MSKKNKRLKPPSNSQASIEPSLQPHGSEGANASEEDPRVFSEVLPPDGTDQASRVVRLRTSIEFVGPLPPPEVLAAYGRIRKDLVPRIVEMAEKQQSHRHRMEERAMRSSITLSGAGLVTGFLIGLAGLGAATWMVILNHDTAGIIIGSADLVALVSVFVYGKRRSRNEDGSKSQKRSRVDSNRVEDDSPRQESKPNNDEGSPDH